MTASSSLSRFFGYPIHFTAMPAPQDAAERCRLTVMFCDLVDSTALSARLDPEHWAR